MARESIQDKGRRLLTEGRLTVTRVEVQHNSHGGIRAVCKGDSAKQYDLGFDPLRWEWRCTCEARGLCSHLVALQLVCLEPKPPSGGEFPE